MGQGPSRSDGRESGSGIVSLDNAGVLALEPAGFQWVGRGDFNGNLTMNKGWFHFLVDGVPTRRAMFEICLANTD